MLKQIKEISAKRNYEDALIKCELILNTVRNLNRKNIENEIAGIKEDIVNQIDNLKIIIGIERRFVLFPLADIKKEAYEIGKKYMTNFIEWVKAKDNLTPEKLIGILEDDIYRLDEMKEIITKN